MADPPAQLLADRLLAGRYRLTRLLGRGGMAQVWEAQDDVLARPVAIKILHQHLATDPDFLERFRREAIAAARIHSPHVVATYDAGTDGDRASVVDHGDVVVPFIVMELVRGRNLRQLLSENGPLPLDQAVSIGLQVCEAVASAHAVGLVHRDVKPANILICEEPPFVVTSPLIKVTDFGVARMTDAAGSDLTRTGMLVGTAAYLSPEQVEGRAGDARSDVYSVGVVLHEMIGGAPPYHGETELATALQHIQASPPPLRQLRPSVPPVLEGTVLRALCRQPENRYQSALELREALAGLETQIPTGEAAPSRRPPAPASPTTVAPRMDPSPTPTDAEALTVITARPRSSPPRAGHRGTVVVLVSGIAAVAAIGGLVLTGRGGTANHRGASGTHSTTANPVGGTGSPLPVTGVSLLDTPGSDNPTELAAVVDGNPATTWMSSYYATARFGNLKDGVGVIVELGQSRRVQQLVVDSPTVGWSASVYVGQQPSETLSDWGAPITAASGVNGSSTFRLGGQSGRDVLLWITTPGNTAPWANRMAIQELAVTGS